MSVPTNRFASSEPSIHVVGRLAQRVREARAMGFHVRQELLFDGASNWCEIGGRKTVFLDSSQPAGEQLQALDAAIRNYRAAA